MDARGRGKACYLPEVSKIFVVLQPDCFSIRAK